uniref:Ras-related protein ORAB-1 n=1 Tax=Phallusia mammillata TaxID=59560 RepID=A0A6F9DQG3_9ASCI|nr:ras-related protein ORAB-1 [Phallusia mammillata]
MTMAAEIKNRMGPGTAASPGEKQMMKSQFFFAVAFCIDETFTVGQRANVDITSKPVDGNKGGCC